MGWFHQVWFHQIIAPTDFKVGTKPAHKRTLSHKPPTQKAHTPRKPMPLRGSDHSKLVENAPQYFVHLDELDAWGNPAPRKLDGVLRYQPRPVIGNSPQRRGNLLVKIIRLAIQAINLIILFHRYATITR